ncbi:hypothetical protein P8452_55836 [Trifolium repens]|nr:hypothetical protein P8452_55836 [Trifolium repens]
MVAIFVDPLFLFLIYVQKDFNCIAINRTMTETLVLLRSMNDFVYFSNILLQAECMFKFKLNLRQSNCVTKQIQEQVKLKLYI